MSLETAINEGLNGWYQAAVQESGIRPLSRPEVEITEVPDPTSTDGELKFHAEVYVRPEIELPDYAGIKVEVAAADILRRGRRQGPTNSVAASATLNSPWNAPQPMATS